MDIRLALLLFVALASCKSVDIAEMSSTSDCIVVDGNVQVVDSLVLGIDVGQVTVEPGNLGQNPPAVERVFRQLNSAYPFRVDCSGRLLPELFSDWSRRGNTWVMTPVGTTSAERRDLSTAMDRHWSVLQKEKPYTGLNVDSDGNLLIAVKRGSRVPPAELSRPDFSLNTSMINADLGRPGIRIVDLTGTDIRDHLDVGVDLLVSDDPDVLDFLSTTEDLKTVKLPADRIYAFISVTRATEGGSDMVDAPAELTSAVPAGTTARLSDAWWTSPMDCGLVSESIDTTSVSATRYHKIVYPVDDHVAKGLAERMIALPQIGILDSSYANHFVDSIPGFRERRHVLRTEGLAPKELLADLEDGNAFGYIVSLPIDVSNRCDVVTEIAHRYGWLTPETFRLSVVPLILSRPFLVTGSRVPSIARDDNDQLFFTTRARGNP